MGYVVSKAKENDLEEGCCQVKSYGKEILNT